MGTRAAELQLKQWIAMRMEQDRDSVMHPHTSPSPFVSESDRFCQFDLIIQVMSGC